MSVVRTIAGCLSCAALAVSILLSAAGVISELTLDHVFLFPAAWAVFSIAKNAGCGLRGAVLTAAAVPAGLAVLQLYWPSLRYAPYLAIAPANLVLAHLFASGLLPGRQPVLLRLIILMGLRPVEDRRFRRFVAWQCVFWSVMTFATAVLALAAVVLAPVRADLVAALGWLIAVQVFWFAASHLYAGFRYDRPETCWATLRAMAMPGLWSKLRA